MEIRDEKISETQPAANTPRQDLQPDMPHTRSCIMGSTAAIIVWHLSAPPKKRGPGRPKKPPKTILTGLRIPKANGRPRHPIKPPGKPGAPKKYDATTMSEFLEHIRQRKSKARAEGRSISDDRALRDDIIEHYQLEKRVADKVALGLPKRAAEDRVFKETRLPGDATFRPTSLDRRFRTLKVLLSKFRKSILEIRQK